MVQNNKHKIFRVLIVENNAVFRRGLEQLLNHEPDISVCGNIDSAKKALQMMHHTRPDLVIADMSLKDGKGISLIREMHQVCPGIPVLVLSMHDESVYARLAISAGATGYITTSQSPETIIEVVHRILNGEMGADEISDSCRGDITSHSDH